ncbi:MAG TPA: ECF transporter S component [Ruminococcus sp.]|nr:ECF transporter S component [Ruminococcus sp.]
MIKNKQRQGIVPSENSYKIKKMVILALLSAMAYIITFVCRLPIMPSASFLDLEFKSAIILIGSFIFGPLSGFVMSVVICLLEMVTFSTTGIIGCIMNIIATVCFVCPAAYVYKKKKNTSGAIVGIVIGTILMTVAMLLWNYIVTPIYMGIPREAITSMLLPVYVPFNLLKSGLNGGIALFIFKFANQALQKTHLIPTQDDNISENKNSVVGAVIVSCLIIITCVLVIFAYNGIF